MKRLRYVSVGMILAALVVALGFWQPAVKTANADKPKVPRFVADPFYPKPLPDKWVTGEMAGTCIDSNDHLITVNRGNLVSPETVVAVAPPPVIRFDKDGHVVNTWGNPRIRPNGIHATFVDSPHKLWLP